MSKSLYITAAGGKSGKALVVLGVMDLLTRNLGRVGFFRPVIRDLEDMRDWHIELLSKRYDLHFEYSSMYGVTRGEARTLLLDGQEEVLIKNIFSKFKALEAQCDFILCEGTDFSSFAESLEFDFNARLADNLGSPILIVVNGSGKSAAESADIIEYARETFVREGCSVVASVVNRVEESEVSECLEELSLRTAESDSVFVIPEDNDLTRLTLGDVKGGLEAELLIGKESSLGREIYDTKIAAMQIPNFLRYLSTNALVITPGDREDIILSCLLSILSENCPNIAGILLTGGLSPSSAVERLIADIKGLNLPIMTVPTDTFTTATQLNELRARIWPLNERKVATALNLFDSHVDQLQLLEQIAVTKAEGRTPIMFEYELLQRAKENKQHIVLPEGTDERILRAAEILLRRDVARLTLLGEPKEVRQKIASFGLDLGDTPIIDPLTSEKRQTYADVFFELRKHKGVSPDQAYDVVSDVSYFGTMMVYCSDADGMVSGAAHTTQHTIRPAFQTIKTRPGVSVVSSVFLMCLPDRVVVFGDCAVNPDPDSEQLAQIAISSADTASTFGIEPRVALLSYSTGESGKGAEVDKVRRAAEIAGELRPDLKLEGPLQFDAAFDPGVAAKKMPGSEVAGTVTVFVFPDLNTGNNTYKAVQRTARVVAIVPVLQGLKKPVNDLSRGCTVTDAVNTIAITAIQAQMEHRG